ncbi:MAG: YciE/YciF ferroxidase family protein, partial [Flavisolibacter sp.]
VTKVQKKRLDQVQKLMGEQKTERKKGLFAGLFGGKHECKAMKGIVEEANSIMAEEMNPEVMDAAIIASAQKVEHYEITSYGTARSFARELGLTKVQELLQQTLDEEYEADNLLTVLAESSINKEAETADEASASSGRRTSAERSRTAELEPVSNKRSTSSARSNTSAGSGKSGSGNRTNASARKTSSGRSGSSRSSG